jgi:hypothetical protein
MSGGRRSAAILAREEFGPEAEGENRLSAAVAAWIGWLKPQMTEGPHGHEWRAYPTSHIFLSFSLLSFPTLSQHLQLRAQ